MAARGRGGRGGARGGRGAFGGAGGGMLAGQEVSWDLSGLEHQGPTERFPEAPAPQAGPPSAKEAAMVQHYLAVRDRVHDGPFYTILNDGMKSGLKRKANAVAPTEASLFNPFTDNLTFSSQYLKKRRRLPKLEERPYAVEFFPLELHEYLGLDKQGASDKKRTLGVDKTLKMNGFKSKLDNLAERIEEEKARAEEDDEEEGEEEAEDEEKEDAGDDEDNWSAVSSDSEESGDDYNAEQYFDNGEDDDIDDDTYENAYDI